MVAPFQPGTAAGRFLDKTGGRGGYMAIFCCDDPDERGAHAKAMGVRTANVIDHAPYHGVQLHPRDCRAAFIEFNHTDGSDDILGPYPPAGPDWQKSIRKDVTQALIGVEMESPEPQGLAEHWGRIIGIAVSKDQRGEPELKLPNAGFRFVKGASRHHERADVSGRRCRQGARCGQGEGLCGVGRCVRARRRHFPSRGVSRLIARHCERAKRRSNPFSLQQVRWIASHALAMTIDHDRTSRNAASARYASSRPKASP